MTTAKAVEIFSLLIDKYNSPSLMESEVIDFLNMAQQERMRRLLPDDRGGQVNFEFDQNTAANIQPFVYVLDGLNTTSGVLTQAVINTDLAAASDVGATYLRILNVLLDGELPVKYTKQNNIGAYFQNFFKVPSATSPRYTVDKRGIVIYPENDTADVTLTVLKNPRLLAPSVDPEWDDANVYLIIMIALQLAGVSIRDSELIQEIKANSNIAQ